MSPADASRGSPVCFEFSQYRPRQCAPKADIHYTHALSEMQHERGFRSIFMIATVTIINLAY